MRTYLGLLVPVALGGCVSTTSALRERFALERGCPESQVEVHAVDGTRYRARGCDESATYVCGTFAKMNDDTRDCVEEGARPARGPGERERPALPPADPRVPERGAPGPVSPVRN